MRPKWIVDTDSPEVKTRKQLLFKIGQARIHSCSAMWVLPNGQLRVRNLIYSPGEYRSDEIMGRGWTEYPHRLHLEEIDLEGDALGTVLGQMRQPRGAGAKHLEGPVRDIPKEFRYCQRCEFLKKQGKEIPYDRQGSCYDHDRPRRGPPRKPRPVATYFQCDDCTAERAADAKAEAAKRAKDPGDSRGPFAIPFTRVFPRTLSFELTELKPMAAPVLSEALFPLAKKGDIFDYTTGHRHRGFVNHFYEYDPEHKGPTIGLCGDTLAPEVDDRLVRLVFNKTGGRIRTTDCALCYARKRAILVQRKADKETK